MQTMPRAKYHKGGWVQLPLFPYPTEHGRNGATPVALETSTAVVVSTPVDRSSREWLTWGGRWVALLMAGFFDSLLVPEGFRLTGISYQSFGGEARLRFTCAKSNAGMVAFIQERRRLIWREAYQVAVRGSGLRWQKDRFYHEP